jgi:hypothetical protein
MSKVQVSKAFLIAALCTATFTARRASADSDVLEPKSRTEAIVLSASGTALSLSLVTAGLATSNSTVLSAGVLSSLVTPSAGEIYAGQIVTWGMAMRVASAGIGLAGVSEALKCFDSEGTCQNNQGLATTLLLVGGLGYASGIIYDIATAGTAVDHYNNKHGLRVTPLVARSATTGQTFGLGLSGSF